jgi:predicted enzyme related to lactoylglutathione lyase
MSTVTQHAPGTFCWFELATTDQQAAKAFYADVLGWSATDSPMGPGQFYTMFNLGGRNTAGGYTLMDDMKAQGIPPHWMVYVAVENADVTAGKVAAAGGKLMAPPFDVMTYGRMAVIQDPTGAVISIWQPATHPGSQVMQEPGSFVWADLMTPDPARAADFYRQVFGWEADPGKDNSGYLHLKAGEHFIGGIPPAGSLPPGTPPNWLLYVAVENCDASTAKATSKGARVYMGPMTMEGVGRWSVVADPQGAVLALFEAHRR